MSATSLAFAVVLVVGFAVLYLTGAAPWPLILATSVVATLAFAARLGAIMGLAAAVIGSWWIVLAAAVTARTASLALEATFAVALATLSIGSLVMLVRSGGLTTLRREHLWSRRGLLFIVTGPLVWLAGEVAAASVSRWGFVSWAMSGDSANNVLFARAVVGAGGVHAWAEPNVAPFPYAILAVPMAPGRGVTASSLAASDLAAYALTWRLLIVLLCLMAGVLAFALADRAPTMSPRSAAIAGGVGSLLPLSWFMTGYPLSFGFYNAHVALPLALAALLAYVGARERPALAVVLLAANATLVLATWSPLVVVPGALVLTVLVRERRRLMSASGRTRWAMGFAVAQLVLYFVVTVLPVLLSSSGLLGATGGFTAFPRWGLPVLFCAASLGSFFVYRRADTRLAWGILSLGAGLVAGLAAVLALGGRGFTDWLYYPHKFAWLAEAILLLVLAGLIPAAIHRLRGRWTRTAWTAVALASGLALFGSLAPLAPPVPEALVLGQPAPVSLVSLARAGDHDALPTLVAHLADDDTVRVYWRSGEPLEYAADFWALQLLAGARANDMPEADLFDLRTIAYSTTRERPEDLCDLGRLTGLPVMAYTRDSTLAATVEVACGGMFDVRVELMD